MVERTRARAGRATSVGLYVAAAAFSAAAHVAAFPPLGVWPAAFVMLVPLVAALDGATLRAAFFTTYLYTVAAALAIVRWLVVPLATDFDVAPLRAWAFTCGLVGAYALIHAAAAVVWVALRTRVRDALAPLAFAAIWVLGEWLRGGPLALPWIRSADAVVPAPILIQVADLGGAAAVGFVVVACSAGIGLAFARGSWRPLVAPSLVLASSLGYGALHLADSGDAAPDFRVGVVQASIPPAERFVEGSAARNLARHLEMSERLIAEGPLDLVVWAETSVETPLETSPATMAALQQFVDRSGVPLVTGALRHQQQRFYTNSIAAFRPGTRAPEAYDKQRLVPFAEYDPALAAWWRPLVGELSRDEPFTPGSAARPLQVGEVRVGTPVCFEITYAEDVRRFRQGGARLLVNLSNDAWFGRTGFAELHLGHARLRAVESRSWVVRGANTGISALIDPEGRVFGATGVFREETLRGRVGLAGPEPFFVRHGSLPAVCVLGAGLLVFVGIGRGRSRR